jgi:predicted RNase H-like HicB family nuclease
MTQANQMPYAYVIERADDGGYWAYLPDLPGCTTCGDSIEEVEQNLGEAVALYLSHFTERGMAPPPPTARVGTLAA